MDYLVILAFEKEIGSTKKYTVTQCSTRLDTRKKMSDFKRLEIKKYPQSVGSKTTEQRFWQTFKVLKRQLMSRVPSL
jgi:hypothetical protein